MIVYWMYNVLLLLFGLIMSKNQLWNTVLQWFKLVFLILGCFNLQFYYIISEETRVKICFVVWTIFGGVYGEKKITITILYTFYSKLSYTYFPTFLNFATVR